MKKRKKKLLEQFTKHLRPQCDEEWLGRDEKRVRDNSKELTFSSPPLLCRESHPFPPLLLTTSTEISSAFVGCEMENSMGQQLRGRVHYCDSLGRFWKWFLSCKHFICKKSGGVDTSVVIQVSEILKDQRSDWSRLQEDFDKLKPLQCSPWVSKKVSNASKSSQGPRPDFSRKLRNCARRRCNYELCKTCFAALKKGGKTSSPMGRVYVPNMFHF